MSKAKLEAKSTVMDVFGFYRAGESVLRKYLRSWIDELDTNDLVSFKTDDHITFLSFKNGTLDHNDHILTKDEEGLVLEIVELNRFTSELLDERN